MVLFSRLTPTCTARQAAAPTPPARPHAAAAPHSGTSVGPSPLLARHPHTADLAVVARPPLLLRSIRRGRAMWEGRHGRGDSLGKITAGPFYEPTVIVGITAGLCYNLAVMLFKPITAGS